MNHSEGGDNIREMMSKLSNQKGSISIFVLILLILLFVMIALTSDIARLYAIKVQARHSLNLALRSACSQIDMVALTNADNPQLIIIASDAETKFYQVLQANMRLDGNNNPTTASVADKQVEICYFKVVNTTDLPFDVNYQGYTETINKVSCTGIIKVPVKLSVFARFISGMPEYTELYLHSTVGPETTQAPS